MVSPLGSEAVMGEENRALDEPRRLCTEDSIKRERQRSTLYLLLQPGTGQAKGFWSAPFMPMEPRMDSELMALSIVQDSLLSESS